MSKQALFHTMRPSCAKLLIINLIIITWILGAFPGFAKPASGDSRKCAGKGELCGGIAGIICCPGLSCKYGGNHPDAAGICVDADTEKGRSRSDVRPDDGKKPCIDEGGSIPVIPNAPSCCEGLTLIKPQDDKIAGSSGICTSKCGNGVCDQDVETAYNCPRDCGASEDPFRDNIWDIYDYPVNVPGWEGADWHNARTLVKHEGTAYRLYLYRFMKKGKPVYVGWFDCFNVRECSVMRINTKVELDFDRDTKQVKITKAVPKHQSGKTVFATETKTTRKGKVTISLREVPVFVEAE